MPEPKLPAENSQARHETRDASTRNVLIFMVCLLVAIVGALLASRAIFRYYTSHQKLGPPPTPFENVRELPPAPRLQTTPRQDLHAYLSHEKEILDSYGWVDREKGTVRIPITRAMNLLLERGLPVRSPASLENQAPLRPGEVQQYTVPKGYTPEN